jgi:nucleotide-binding universal stress UspA family protein
VAGTVLVGVDDSAASHAALAFAIDEARLRGAKVVALHAWTFVPAAPVGEPGMVAMLADDLPTELDAERQAAQARLDAAIGRVPPGAPPVELEARLVEGDAGDALVSEGAEADLIVVGSRGRGGLASAILGSTSQHVVRHARCPVIVVKASGEET